MSAQDADKLCFVVQISCGHRRIEIDVFSAEQMLFHLIVAPHTAQVRGDDRHLRKALRHVSEALRLCVQQFR